MRNILITPIYIPHQYTTQHYTGFPLKSFGHSWHKPHCYEIFNISAYQTNTSLLNTPDQVYSIGTPTYSLWLRCTLPYALISCRHSSSMDTDLLWAGRSDVRNLVGQIFSSTWQPIPALRPTSPPQQLIPWLLARVTRARWGFNHPRLSIAEVRYEVYHYSSPSPAPCPRSVMARY